MERECEYCGKILEPDEEAFTLESGEVVCQDCHESIIGKCAECDEILTEDDEYRTLDDGTILCEYCFDEMYAECDECGEITLIDDLTYWGEMRICPSCMEFHCPSFDKAKNEEETTEAYEIMKARYLGKKVCSFTPGEYSFSYEDFGYAEEAPRYEITVTIGEDGRIVDISRLTAQLLLSEDVKSSDWRPYPIDSDDYDSIVEDIFDEEGLEFEDEDDEDDE